MALFDIVLCLGFMVFSQCIFFVQCTDKIFITDVSDGKIFVGENRGPYFYGEDINEVILGGLQAPSGIDYDYRTDKIYWTDEEARTVNRASLDGSNQEILIDQSQGIGYPQEIVLDLIVNKIFWSDTLLERITSANLDGSNRRTIISTGLYRPWGITLSQKRGKLYWTDEGLSTGKIEMSNKDGTDRRQLITNRLTQPYGLAVDSQEQRLYWTEGFYDVIESIDLDDLSDRRDHVYAESGDLVVFSVSLYFTSIYFTDFASRGLHEADGVGEIREITGFTAAPTRVKIYADLTCFESCPGNSRCQLIGFNTSQCYCIYGWGGFNCGTRIKCILPDPPPKASFVNPRDSYAASTTVTVTCDNGNDQVEWTCNGYTGNWDEGPIDCSTTSGGSSVGLIAGIVGGVAFLFLVLIICLVYRVKRKPPRPSSSAPVQNATAPSPSIVYNGGVQPGVAIAPHATIPVDPTPRYNPGPSGAMPGNASRGENKLSELEHDYESTIDAINGYCTLAAAAAYPPGRPGGQAYPGVAKEMPPPYTANVRY